MAKHLIVIGGGAAGFFCAVNAASQKKDLKVTILEKHNKVLQKVKVSGGGRCNVTHACFQPAVLLKKYPRGKQWLKEAFSLFTTSDTINWFAQRGVELHTEADGRIFPVTNNSQTIIDCLLKEAAEYKVELKLNTEIISVEQRNNIFLLKDKKDETLEADFLVVAAGGFPKPEQYQWLQKLGHSLIPPAPSLFTFNIPKHPICKLMGLSVENAIVKIVNSKLSESGPVLITHWGLSGPAILKLSAWGARELQEKNYHFAILINWLGITENALREQWPEMRIRQSNLRMGNKNPFGLPQRLWEYFLEACTINADTKWSELPAKEQNKLIRILTTEELKIEGKTTFKEEFVTCGGIDLHEVDAMTMQSKLVPHLYFAGEILDVDGITGGFNFQHAWTSGYVAAQHISAGPGIL